MNKLLVHWVIVISSLALLAGCTSGGSTADEEEKDPPFDPPFAGSPVFTEINEPYLNTSSSGDGLSLFSYKTQESASDAATDKEILSTSTNIIISLNTEEDQVGRVEYTLIAKNDSVYLVNHLSNEIRLLSHFVNTVCELIPAEKVSENIDPGIERTLTVLHEEFVYVMTAEASSLEDDCLSDSKKRFYELPLDRQLDPSLDENDQFESLALVRESKARAQLIFGWVPDPDQDLAPGSVDPVQHVLDYGYLGYAAEEQELSLFDYNGDQIWTQDRELERFDQTIILPETLSNKYIFHIQALENYQYLIQLGLDVFVVDSGLDLLTKSPNETDTVLDDKVMSVETRVTESDSGTGLVYALPVKALYDTDDLLLVDNAKIYRLAYQSNLAARNPTIPTKIIEQNFFSFDGDEHLSTVGFSQFDLEPCEVGDSDCLDAYDVEAQSWQFLTRCDAQFGCIMPSNDADFCETREEKLQTSSDEPLCTASDYEHLAELNKPENDVELIAYMQFVEEYTRHLEFMLHKNRLFITAQMSHKDLFLAYDFNQDFSSPKPLREQVFFGERASLTGMDAYFSENNLFLTVLQKGAQRSNECYKDDRKVVCQLSELNEDGGSNVCTGKDLAEKLCTDKFNEYESKSIFCNANQLIDLSCSDAVLNQLDDLTVESVAEDAKWLSLYDFATNAPKMYLLAGDHSLALETGNLDEGKLYAPSLFSVDASTGQKETQLTSLEGSIERVISGWLSKEVSLGVAEVIGRINVLTADISDPEAAVKSKLSTYILEQTFENNTTDVPDVIKAPKVSERLFDRL